MQTSNNGVELIKHFEGCRLTAYPDPATAGAPWSIGYGWTQPVDAERLLKTGLQSYENEVSKLVKVPVTQGQFDALVSFNYNLGARALSTSTLLKKLNAGDYEGAAEEFPRWNKAGGKVMNGLTRRREAELALFRQ
eukprot:Blabericola_migrator_1__10267@NODE_5752_length_683_cov_423_746753_g3769_i0_p1_GENE_NODE_5752_length_683_cov_423_746753_g3769_i0NODE_5752_length_683_cov_423_746753_g3769_i0_p1_ORF_typecomplete_len136_score4_16Phage_lysozyme/PF00959_19/5_3e34_NODE_5752_length_683_cov_423_746753_g3769_i076483